MIILTPLNWNIILYLFGVSELLVLVFLCLSFSCLILSLSSFCLFFSTIRAPLNLLNFGLRCLELPLRIIFSILLCIILDNTNWLSFLLKHLLVIHEFIIFIRVVIAFCSSSPISTSAEALASSTCLKLASSISLSWSAADDLASPRFLPAPLILARLSAGHPWNSLTLSSLPFLSNGLWLG